jgi:hypothetical protein
MATPPADDAFLKTISEHGDKALTEDEQKKVGKPTSGGMKDEHREFLKTLKKLIESDVVDPYNPKTFIRQEVYESLDEEWLEKTDLTLLNMAGLVKQIYELYIRKDTPNASNQYQTMILQLFEMKQRIEEHHDVFVF